MLSPVFADFDNFALLSYAYFYRALDDIVKLTKKDQTEGGEGQ